MGIITDVEHYRTEQPPPSSPSYTLAELTDLANRYADDIDDDDLRLTVRLNLSGLLTWLGKKEREGNER